jgi:hypothetical protein
LGFGNGRGGCGCGCGWGWVVDDGRPHLLQAASRILLMPSAKISFRLAHKNAMKKNHGKCSAAAKKSTYLLAPRDPTRHWHANQPTIPAGSTDFQVLACF